MVKLKAILAESGQGIIDKDEVLYHIAPPYDLDSQTFINEKNFEFALEEQGFKEMGMDFGNLGELTDYLVESYEKWRSEAGLYAEQMDDTMVIQNLSGQFIEIFIQDLEKEIIGENNRFIIDTSNELLKNINLLANQRLRIQKILTKVTQETKKKATKELIEKFPNIGFDKQLKQQFYFSNYVGNVALKIPSNCLQE